jgi:hypothetical protein
MLTPQKKSRDDGARGQTWQVKVALPAKNAETRRSLDHWVEANRGAAVHWDLTSYTKTRCARPIPSSMFDHAHL